MMSVTYRFNEIVFALVLIMLTNTAKSAALQNGAGELSGREAVESTCNVMHLNKIILSNMCIRRHRFYNVDPELTEIPEHIVQCYTNYELWDRYKRLPSSIDSLVALIRYSSS